MNFFTTGDAAHDTDRLPAVKHCSTAGTFAAAAERLHITPSAVSHAVSGVEAECGFPLFTRTKSGVTLTAAAEKLMPAIQQMLASSESLDQSIAQINGMHKGALRWGCSTRPA